MVQQMMSIDSFNIVAVGLVTPGFLAAGAVLAAIPIIIHILNRRRFKTVTWAAMNFLLAAMKKNQRRLKFEQWLLLATRCLLLGLLGLALARPLGCADSGLAGTIAGTSGLTVIVIDDSYSMGYQYMRSGARNHFEHARNLAKSLIDRVGSGEAVAIVTASAPSRVVFEPGYDLTAAMAAVDRLALTDAATDLAGALERANDIARATTQPNRRLVLLTDATRGALDGPFSEALKQNAREAADAYRITFYNLGAPRGSGADSAGQTNFAVTRIGSGSPLPTSRQAQEFSASVAGFGQTPEVTLRWRIDDQPAGPTPQLRPSTDTPDAVMTTPIAPGYRVVSATVAGDSRLPLDDTRSHVFDVVDQIPVLIVEGNRGMGDDMKSSAAYLVPALAPRPTTAVGEGGTAPAPLTIVSPTRISDLDLPTRVLSEFRVVVLAGVGSIAPGVADQLEKFVRDGGTLVFTMSDAVSLDNYNSQLLPKGLLPGPLVKPVVFDLATQEGARFAIDFRTADGLLRPFRGEATSGLDAIRVWRYIQVEPRGDEVERVLSYTSAQAVGGGAADPAITLHRLGRGSVVLLTTAVGDDGDTIWNTMLYNPAIVTLARAITVNAVTSSTAWLNLEVGQWLEVPSSIKLAGAPALNDPQRKPIPMTLVQNEAGESVYRSTPLTRAGLYELINGTERYPVSVSPPADEADVRSVDAAAVASFLGDVPMTVEGDTLALAAVDDSRLSDFGWTVMLAVLMLVGFECFLAMRFGHHRVG